MSSTSPPRRGRNRTRSPTLPSVPPMVTCSTCALSSSACHSHSFMSALPERAQCPNDAMQFHELLGWHRFGALQNLPSAIVSVPHLLLLLIGQSHDAQRQDFIDLRAVKQIAGAFGTDLRIVVENDGRRQQSVFFSSVANQHGPCANVPAARRQILQPLGWLQQRDKFTTRNAQNQMGRD